MRKKRDVLHANTQIYTKIMEKLRITQYFDSIINEIDILTETKIQQNQAFEEFYNERRQKQIDILKEFEQENLLRVENTLNTGKKSEESNNADGRFWSVIEFADTWFLVRSNKNITPEEKELFRVLLRWPNSTACERLKFLSDFEEVPRREEFWLKVIHFNGILNNIIISFVLV